MNPLSWKLQQWLTLTIRNSYEKNYQGYFYSYTNLAFKIKSAPGEVICPPPANKTKDIFQN